MNKRKENIYIPDFKLFYLDCNISYWEVKGSNNDICKLKASSVKEFGFDIKVLFKNDIIELITKYHLDFNEMKRQYYLKTIEFCRGKLNNNIKNADKILFLNRKLERYEKRLIKLEAQIV